MPHRTREQGRRLPGWSGSYCKPPLPAGGPPPIEDQQDRATGSHQEQGISWQPCLVATVSHRFLPGGCPLSRTCRSVPRDRSGSRGADQGPGPVNQHGKLQTTTPCRGSLPVEDCLLPAGSCRWIALGAGEQISSPVRFYQRRKLPQAAAEHCFPLGPSSCWGPFSCSQDLRHRIAGGEKTAKSNYLLFFVHLTALPPYYLAALSLRCGKEPIRIPQRRLRRGASGTMSVAYYSSLVGAISLSLPYHLNACCSAAGKEPIKNLQRGLRRLCMQQVTAPRWGPSFCPATLPL
ncbi:hypothetical protein NDU88_001325 [Pleurodeles waltl]|uniref:Uncharacterized protein n=1 Tax=Pleurodeles waltl TaxID=8319 RepID=A0AAV7U610_PLEWA|nr:hypothetical protein NDU88_001325 [Pleurodeles waltl]